MIINRPIGLVSPCREIEAICNNAQMYKRCGRKPKHLLIPLDVGSGRTTFIEYLTDMYRSHGILGFSSGLDDYIELTIDASSTRKIAQGFAAFQEAAIYENHYRNVAAINISDVAKHLGEPQLQEFLKGAKQLCDSAYVVFFINGHPSANEERLADKLIQHIGKHKIQRITVEPYTVADFCALVEKSIEELGFNIEDYHMFHAALMDSISTFDITSVRDALNVADELVNYADYSGFTPTVDDKGLTALATAWQFERQRSESK